VDQLQELRENAAMRMRKLALVAYLTCVVPIAFSGGWGDSGWENGSDTAGEASAASSAHADDIPATGSRAGWGDSGWLNEPAPETEMAVKAPQAREQTSEAEDSESLAGDWMYAWKAIHYSHIQGDRDGFNELASYVEHCDRQFFPSYIPFNRREAAVGEARRCMLKQLELADLTHVPPGLSRGVVRLAETGDGYTAKALAADGMSDYGYIHQNTIRNAVRSVRPGTELMRLRRVDDARYEGKCLVAPVFDYPPKEWTRCELELVTKGRAILALYWQPGFYWDIPPQEKSAWAGLASSAPPLRYASLIRISGGLGAPLAAPASAGSNVTAVGRGGNCWVGCRPGSSPLRCAVACDGQFSATTALANGGHTVFKLKNASWEQCVTKMRELGQVGW
jgi:hypothetical protein